MCSIFHKLLQHALTGFYITTDLMQQEHKELLLYDEACPDISVLLQSPRRKPSNLFNRARCDPCKTSSILINITGSQNLHIKVQNKWSKANKHILLSDSHTRLFSLKGHQLILMRAHQKSIINTGVIWRNCRKLIKVYLRFSVGNWAQEPVLFKEKSQRQHNGNTLLLG